MNFAIPPIMGGEHGATIIDSLSISACKRLIGLHSSSSRLKGSVQLQGKSSTKVIAEIRQVETYIIHQREEWVDQILIEYAMKANERYFGYNLSGLIERPQLLKYESPSVGYKWHCDLGNGDASNRKLSTSIILNSNYKGGELHFFTNGENVFPTKQGNIIFFSSFFPHCITPITKGTRWALVAWFSGPQFR
tara:strand:+ start:3905 stop:4480 length:576 start_codon:yes stop_codon:yes gene_type:complete